MTSLLPVTVPFIIIEELQNKLSHLVKPPSDKHKQNKGKMLSLCGEILLLCLVFEIMFTKLQCPDDMENCLFKITLLLNPMYDILCPQILSVARTEGYVHLVYHPSLIAGSNLASRSGRAEESMRNLGREGGQSRKDLSTLPAHISHTSPQRVMNGQQDEKANIMLWFLVLVGLV
jgi:hypothetical protein